MMDTAFPYTSVTAYLEATGILETGTARDIEQARKTFRKLYLKHYQKRRNTKTHDGISLSFTKAEKKLLAQSASENGKKLASFIKTIALNYVEGETIAIDTPDMSECRRLFSISYDIIEELEYENSYPELTESYQKLADLFKQIEVLLK